MTQITHNLAAVRQRIVTATRSYGRDPDSVHLLAVSKKHSVESLREAISAGQRDFGESFVSEALDKQSQLQEQVTWHFIGKIQSNKARLVAQHFDWVHSLDRLKIARRLHRFRGSESPLNVLIQVNISDDPTRMGVLPDKLAELATEVTTLSGLKLRGLMAMAPLTADAGLQNQAFAQASRLFGALQDDGFEMDSLSMGMSADLEPAIANGATWVRIGTDIFGKRPPD